MAWPLSSSVGLDGTGLEEVEEHARGGRERTAAGKHQGEMPREVEALDCDHLQFLGVEFFPDGQLREESDPEAPPHGILDGRVAAELERDIQDSERGAGLLEAPLQDTARARPRFTDDEPF